MIMRTQRRFVVFSNPFVLKGIDRLLPPGRYEVVTDEELIEGLSFPVYRRVLPNGFNSSTPQQPMP
jgi:hypothetical protein